MGLTRDEITLTNAADRECAVRGYIAEKDVRSVTVGIIADTGALRLTIPESLREKLGLRITKTVIATLANGEKLECGLTEGVEVYWKDRIDISQAWVVPHECPVLLGRMLIAGLDIMGDHKDQLLVGIRVE